MARFLICNKIIKDYNIIPLTLDTKYRDLDLAFTVYNLTINCINHTIM